MFHACIKVQIPSECLGVGWVEVEEKTIWTFLETESPFLKYPASEKTNVENLEL